MPISLPHIIELSSGKKISLRAMNESDITSVLDIEKSANPSPWNAGNFRSSVNNSDHALVAEEVFETSLAVSTKKLETKKEILAFAVFSIGGGEAEVLNIAVAKILQKQGLAKNILACFIKSVTGDIDNLFLEVRASNQVAINLYHGLGFNQVGLRSNYYPKAGASSEKEDALIFAYAIF